MFSKKIAEEKWSYAEREEQAWEQSLQRKDYRGQVLIDSHVCLLWYCWCLWVQVTPCLCSGHVLRRCSAMLGATGCSLEVCIVFWPMGLVDNLHPIAIECDSAEVSTGHRISSVGRWFITWHTRGARWCISKKFTKESLKFIWDAGIQIRRDAWLCNIQRWVICLQVLLIYILTDIRMRPVVGVFGSVVSSPSLGFICWPRKLSGNWRAEVFHGIFGPSLQRPLSLSHQGRGVLSARQTRGMMDNCFACWNVLVFLRASRHLTWRSCVVKAIAACNCFILQKHTLFDLKRP